jgi:hypothetical protein
VTGAAIKAHAQRGGMQLAEVKRLMRTNDNCKATKFLQFWRNRPDAKFGDAWSAYQDQHLREKGF